MKCGLRHVFLVCVVQLCSCGLLDELADPMAYVPESMEDVKGGGGFGCFIVAQEGFEGYVVHLDHNIVAFSVEVPSESAEDYWSAIDNGVREEGWAAEEIAPNHRVYRNPAEGSIGGEPVVEVEFDANTRRLYITSGNDGTRQPWWKIGEGAVKAPVPSAKKRPPRETSG